MRGKYASRISTLDPVRKCREIVFLLTGTLKLRAWVLKRPPDRQHPHLLTEMARPTYPEGYKVEELGTFREHSRKTEKRHDPG